MSWDDDDNNGGGLGLLIFATIVLLPVIPAGDMSIYFINTYIENAPNIVYIIGWPLFGAIWLYVCWKIITLFVERLWLIILLIYIQGIALVFLIEDTKYAGWSNTAAKLLYGIFIGNDK